MIPKYRSSLVLLALVGLVSCESDPVEPSPAIGVAATTISFSGTAGAANPAAQTVAVTNTGGGTLSGLTVSTTFGSGQPTGWLAASLSGTTAPATLTLTPTTGALAAGTYNATVSVAAAGATNSPRTIAVTFTVAAASGHTFSYTPPAAAPTITSVSVPGEFSDPEWTPDVIVMTEQGGTWSVTVDLEPGEYQYKFHINNEWPGHMCNDETFGHPMEGGFWIDVNATRCEEDGFGGANAVIVIP